MQIIALALALAFAPGAVEEEDQDARRRRINELLAQADQENKKGNAEAAKKCMAEAWALTSEVYAEQGNKTLASEAWRTAVGYGWKGKSPVDSAEAPRTERPKPPIETEKPAPKPPGQSVQDERPSFERTSPGGSRRLPPLEGAWRRAALSPYAGSRANGWHGLLNTPPLESSWTLPKGQYEAGLRLDLSTIDFADGGGGGPTVWHVTSMTETLEVDYGISDRLQAGLRLTMGQVGEADDDWIRVFENGRQIVPTDTRDFGIESIVGRAKLAIPASFADLGLLTELKIPIADESDFLTAQTLDWGVSGLLSKRWDRVAVHLALGVVVPIGDAELFLANDDLDPYVHVAAGVAGSPLEPISLFAQVEYNSSAFGDVGVLDAPVLSLHFGGRYKVTPTMFLGGALGFGLSDESGDLFLSSSIDLAF